jgi:hypothetical protein
MCGRVFDEPTLHLPATTLDVRLAMHCSVLHGTDCHAEHGGNGCALIWMGEMFLSGETLASCSRVAAFTHAARRQAPHE